ncbi:uncharacterized protein RJT21DRAFT_56961 [Scheffersomyces amazonensis]|uniref:uncharacterized protein n=1 Tax=Scheffersomyces amazonensis TaxID=1078765 RepID=UPI00315CFDA3
MSAQSGILDQILLEDIARHCPHQFLAFHNCMSKPDPDPEFCDTQQRQLASCIKTVVPSFQRIQTQCVAKLNAYESCLKSNNSKAEKCSPELQSLRDCALGSLNK